MPRPLSYQLEYFACFLNGPKLGEGHLRVSICVPRSPAELDAGVRPLILVAEGGGFVLGQPTDGESNDRILRDSVSLYSRACHCYQPLVDSRIG